MKQRKLTLASTLTVTLVLLMVATLGYQGYQFSLELKKADIELKNAESKRDGGDHPLASLPTDPHRSQRLSSAASRLINQNLFGKVGKESPKKPIIEVQDIPSTRLKLTLRGVSVSDDPEFASALVEGPDRKTGIYTIDAELPGNATLHEVYKDRIVINRKGILEKLYFPKENDPAAARIASNNARRYTPPPAPPRPSLSSAIRGGTSKRAGNKDRKAEIKERLRALRERMQDK